MKCLVCDKAGSVDREAHNILEMHSGAGKDMKLQLRIPVCDECSSPLFWEAYSRDEMGLGWFQLREEPDYSQFNRILVTESHSGFFSVIVAEKPVITE